MELVVGRQTAETEGEIIRIAVVASGTKTNLPQSVTHWLLVLNKNCRQKNKDFFLQTCLYLREENDDKDDRECPGGEEPEDRELSPDGRVVLHHGKHVEPLYGDSQDGEEARDNGDNKQAIEQFEMVATLLDDGGDQADDPVQEEGEGEEGGGDGVGVGEETVRQRAVNELLDENHEGEDAGDEADAAEDDIKRGQLECHYAQLLSLPLTG